MFTHIFRILFFVSTISFFSCKKDSEILNKPVNPKTDSSKTSVVFYFKANVNGDPLTANTKWYTLANSDSFTVTKFNYYISNIKLKRDDGFIFSEFQSYHLIRHIEGDTSFVIDNLPFGNYTQIEFMIGVDSLRNHSGAQTGALDVTNGMFWEWNSGYIFFKLEGDYKTPNLTEKSIYTYHIGSDSYLKKCSLNLTPSLISAKDKKPSVSLSANIDEIFLNPIRLNLDSYHAVSGGKEAGVIAENYKDMFSVQKIEN